MTSRPALDWCPEGRVLAGALWTRHCTGRGVEVGRIARGRWALVRRAQDPDGPMIIVRGATWAAFLAAVKSGAFDR